MKLRSKYPLTIICLGLVWLFGAQSVSALTLDEAVKLLASDRAAGDRFGFSVSVDGNTAVIGAFAVVLRHAPAELGKGHDDDAVEIAGGFHVA